MIHSSIERTATGRRTRFLRLGALVILPCASCSAIAGLEGDDRNDAIGFVTVSTPLFTPINNAVEGDQRLQFGKLRNEEALAEAVNSPTMAMSELSFQAWRLALAAKVAGPQLSLLESLSSSLTSERSINQATSQSIDNGQRSLESTLESLQAQKATNELKRQETRTFESPGAPESAPATRDTPTDVRSAMLELLRPSPTKFKIPPDAMATLVAAYKTYMVNLEEYYNVDGFGYADGITTEWLPYRAHFTVTAEPGWYTRYHNYDAVAELTLDSAPGLVHGADIRVLTVMPPEAAQAIEQFTAALQEFSAALSLEGALQAIGVKAAVENVSASAKRLQGIQSTKTFVVSYPAPNKVRIRFRPQSVPSDAEHDIQPVSRVFTALCLVRNVAVDTRNETLDYPQGSALAAATTEGDRARQALALTSLAERDPERNAAFDKYKDFMAEHSSRPAIQAIKQHRAGTDDPTSRKELRFVAEVDPKSTSTPKGNDVQDGQGAESELVKARELARDVIRVEDAIKKDPGQFQGREYEFQQRGYFTPALSSTANLGALSLVGRIFTDAHKHLAPEDPVCASCASRPNVKCTCKSADSARNFYITPWFGATQKPLEVVKAFGYYAANLSSYRLKAGIAAAAQKKWDDAKSKLNSAQKAYEGAEVKVSELDTQLGQLKRDLKLADQAKSLAEARVEAAGKNPELQRKAHEELLVVLREKDALERTLLENEEEREGLKKSLPKLLDSVKDAEVKLTKLEDPNAKVEEANGAWREAVSKTQCIVAIQVRAPKDKTLDSPVTSSHDPNARAEVRRKTASVSVWGRVVSSGSGDFTRLGAGDFGTTLPEFELDLSGALPPPPLDDDAKFPVRIVRVFAELGLQWDKPESNSIDFRNPWQRVVREAVLEPRTITPILESAAASKSGQTSTTNTESRPADPEIKVHIGHVKMMLEGDVKPSSAPATATSGK